MVIRLPSLQIAWQYDGFAVQHYENMYDDNTQLIRSPAHPTFAITDNYCEVLNYGQVLNYRQLLNPPASSELD